jgi:Tfp pilus assembly PilM family ATPase
MKTKTYYFIITVFALIGLTLFENYPIVIAIAAFGIGIGYGEYTQEEEKEDDAGESSLSRILHYSFDEIDWDYSKLTQLERNAITEAEFEAIKRKYR